MMTRPDADTYFLRVAREVSTRGTCIRRKVGCVLVDEHLHILATGYNGVARGVPHCIDHPCPGAQSASGTDLDVCQAIHAEANALLQCPDVNRIETIYCTASPCIQCVKLLMNTGADRVVFAEIYPHELTASLWISSKFGREWIFKPL
jgi:dCMP deaminase